MACRRPTILGRTTGFTLIEMLVVILIIGILGALAIPKVTDASTRAKVSEALTVLGSYDHAQLAYIMEIGSAGSVDDLTMQDVTVPGFSINFVYTETPLAAGARLMGTATSGISPLSGASIWTDVGDDESVVHDHAPEYEKYAPSWKN
jgi:prepilin-type N-terminal cleavage/methylation domain-containing protein